MGVYLEFIKISFSQKFVYRMNSYISAISSLIKMLILISIWTALFKGQSAISGIQLTDMINFVIVNSIIGSLIYSNIANEIGSKVVDGSISTDFIKPINFKYYIFANQIGENVYMLIFNTVPAILLIIIYSGFTWPYQTNSLLLFFISLINGFIIIYYFNYILGLTTFWMTTSFYIDWFMKAFFQLFAGTFVPLWFYPDFLLYISKMLPFHLVAFEPIAILLGKLSWHESINVICTQFVWIILLIIVEKLIWNKVEKKVIVHGG
ncbi:hypothetical protein BC351_19050 [Paenibacillus ferrarius]|uniref:ABC transporter permease n=1 Tax=Paenibacillus ferrarius TaxID=1469647 RepID=A0A1V4HPY3_9BACL|nr:ABC-2 family transporter protein [Paenibacillus ferrarius]OPH60012.1 hypothetical protein BC351_19050 [Paenibacillus ferrarius]